MNAADERQHPAPKRRGRPSLPDNLKRTARISTRTYPDVAEKVACKGTEWLGRLIRHVEEPSADDLGIALSSD